MNFDLGFKKDVDIRKSVERVKDADIVIFASGISPSLEGEEMGVNLPGSRKEIVRILSYLPFSVN